MEDLWGRYGFRGLAFLLLAVFALLRILQVFFQHKQLKREGLRGNYIAQAVVGLACAAGALVLCEPSIFGLSGTEEKPREPPAPVTTVQRTVPLPPNVRFVGPLAPAKEAIVREDWAALAKIIFDLRRAHGSTNDTNFLLQWKAKPLGKVYLERGREALKAGDMDLARQYLDYAVELLTEDVDPPLLRSETYPPAEWRSTLRDLKQAAERAPPTDTRPVERRFELLLAHGEKQKALENLDVLVHARPTEAQLWIKRGKLRLDVGAVDGAIADLSSVRAALPSDAGVRIELARARLYREEADQWKQALAELDSVLRDAPTNVSALVVRGQARFVLDKFPDAIADFSKAIQLDPRNAEAFLGRGRVRIQQDNSVSALKDMDEALRLDPKLRGALVWRGVLKKSTNPEAALEDLKKAIEIESDAGALLYKGECLVNLRRRDEAEAALSDALLLTRDKVLIDHINAQLLRAKSLRR